MSLFSLYIIAWASSLLLNVNNNKNSISNDRAKFWQLRQENCSKYLLQLIYMHGCLANSQFL